MVMEAPPSPQSVGREFVRQYYTLLNKAPTHLHRFYNNNSSFVHGGLDHNRDTSPIVGQKQIHQKIQQLNFRDCHAKITQVDSQATLSNGVVVQVTGELSNAGQPMRRFTQTFVLAAQSPKKYYVHNDIFRYQDEIISDEECDPENRSEPEDDVNNQERQVIGEVQPMNQQPMGFYNQTTPPLPTMQQHHPAQPPPHILASQTVPTVNGSVHPEEMNIIQGQVPQHMPSPHLQGVGAPMANMQAGMVPVQPPPNVAPVPAVVTVDNVQQSMDEVNLEDHVENNYVDETQETEPIETPEAPQEPVMLNEPKTYATLVKSGGNVGYAAVTQSNSSSQPPKSLSPPIQNHYENRDGPQSGMGNNQMGPRNNMNRGPRVNQPSRMPRQDSRTSGPGKNSFNDDGNTYEERRRSQGNSFVDRDRDSNQLFLGNLPHSATEEDLREIFAEFGQIVELRIHSKPANKGGPPGAKVPPNYGFITYEAQQSVAACLAAKPIYFPRNDSNGTPLNVEEKKNKDRPPYGNNRIGNDNGPRPRDGGGPRRSQGGPGGPLRAGGGNMGPNNRPSNFNRGPPQNRGPTNTYNNRR